MPAICTVGIDVPGTSTVPVLVPYLQSDSYTNNLTCNVRVLYSTSTVFVQYVPVPVGLALHVYVVFVLLLLYLASSFALTLKTVFVSYTFKLITRYETCTISKS